MNKRIVIVSDKAVRIQRSGNQVNPGTLVELDDLSRVVISHELAVVGRWDAEGRDALIEALQCLKATGSFAALADTSAVPYVGKRVRVLPAVNESYEPHVVSEILGAGCVMLRNKVGTAAVRELHELLPLTPPAPRVRQLTPVEAAAHLDRELEFKHRYHYLQAVYLDHVELSPCDNGDIPCPRYKELAELCKWRDTKEPCGVIDA